MCGLKEDTLADKLLRFVIGAVVGAILSWTLVLALASAESRTIVITSVTIVLLTAAASVAFGNQFIEKLIQFARW